MGKIEGLRDEVSVNQRAVDLAPAGCGFVAALGFFATVGQRRGPRRRPEVRLRGGGGLYAAGCGV